LRFAAVLHLSAFGSLMLAEGSADGSVVFVFGLIPAALLFLAAFAMQRGATSLAQYRGQPGVAAPSSPEPNVAATSSRALL
jgi:hypothetical protein